MNWAHILGTLADGGDLTRTQAREAMDEVMSGRMSQEQGMVEMARAQEMMREEARDRTTHPEHRWEE